MRRTATVSLAIFASSVLSACCCGARTCCPSPCGPVRVVGAGPAPTATAPAPTLGTLAPKAEPSMAMTPEMMEAMKKWEAVAAPGPNHQWLGRQVGTWDTASKMWMDPGAPPQESKGTATMRWLLPGRFVAEEVTGSMMGKPFHGFGIHGYDNFKKKFVMSWVDDMGTALLTAEGDLDAGTKTLTMHGLMDEPMTGEKDKKVDYVLKEVDADHFVFEIHDLAIGAPNTKVIEIAYSRRK